MKTNEHGEIIYDDDFVAVEAKGACAACAFLKDAPGCVGHACTRFDFPVGHPMRLVSTSDIIWIKQ